jgi:His-Xaa-Ser system protein HxsD
VADLVLEFSASTQTVDALKEAAYRLIGQATCHIDKADGRYLCRLRASQPSLSDDELRARFLHLVTDENLREKVGRETNRLRDVIVALAFGSIAAAE